MKVKTGKSLKSGFQVVVQSYVSLITNREHYIKAVSKYCWIWAGAEGGGAEGGGGAEEGGGGGIACSCSWI